MRTRIISASDPDLLDVTLGVLNSGGLVAMPTDTVYGLGALVMKEQAVKNIYTAKDRPIEKAIPILIADRSELIKVTLEISPLAMVLAEHFWPGPLTLVVPKHPAIPEAVSSFPTIGVRVPDHPVTRMILHASGPMAVTSANLSGRDDPGNAQEVLDQLDGRIDLIIDAGQVGHGLASTVVNCEGHDPVILREGPITMEQINLILG